MKLPIAEFNNGNLRAEIHWSDRDQQYLVRLHNDLGHDFKAYFHKDDLDKAKSYARGWVDQA